MIKYYIYTPGQSTDRMIYKNIDGQWYDRLRHEYSWVRVVTLTEAFKQQLFEISKESALKRLRIEYD
jgi:hypothetical protein